MNWRSIFVAIPALCAAPAFAQGSVTLYGLVDAGIDYTNNVGGHGAWQMRSEE
ncbi:MAG: porin, partial [Burkholderia sp.]|nr:porin [Burkholderia sp.]